MSTENMYNPEYKLPRHLWQFPLTVQTGVFASTRHSHFLFVRIETAGEWCCHYGCGYFTRHGDQSGDDPQVTCPQNNTKGWALPYYSNHFCFEPNDPCFYFIIFTITRISHCAASFNSKCVRLHWCSG